MTRYYTRRTLITLMIALVTAASLAACGRKGPPVPPGEQQPEYRKRI